jgi:NADPH:quinone reductase-like Zn-dependent oxidoreductase
VRALVRDRYGAPDVLWVDDIDIPAPGAGEVLVRVQAASLNTADLHSVSGTPRAARIGTGLITPKNRVIGLDVAGTVDEVGEDVSSLKPGDEVWADLSLVGGGAFAEYVCATEKTFSPKPGTIGFGEAATIPHSAILALQGLRAWKRPIRVGHKVLINGGGGCVGPFAIQIAKAHGAEVTGVDNAGKLDLMRAAGADHVVDYTHQDVTRNGVTYDRILDIATHRSVKDFRRSLTPDGTYVVIADSLGQLLGATTLGPLVTMGSDKRMGLFRWMANDRDHLAHLAKLADSGELRPIVHRRIGLGEIPEALGEMRAGRTRGKVIVTMDAGDQS